MNEQHLKGHFQLHTPPSEIASTLGEKSQTSKYNLPSRRQLGCQSEPLNDELQNYKPFDSVAFQQKLNKPSTKKKNTAMKHIPQKTLIL